MTLPECRLLLPFALLLHVRESRPSPPVPPSEELCGRTTLPAAVRSDARKPSEMPRPTATDLAQLSTAQRIACTLLNPPKPLPTGPQCLAKPHSRRLAHHSPSVTPLRRNRAHRSRDVRNWQDAPTSRDQPGTAQQGGDCGNRSQTTLTTSRARRSHRTQVAEVLLLLPFKKDPVPRPSATHRGVTGQAATPELLSPPAPSGTPGLSAQT